MSSSTPRPTYAARSRSHASRHGNPMIADSPDVPYVPNAESIILPDGQVGEEAAERLHEFVHPSHGHNAEETLIGDEDPVMDEELARLAKLPWWKRPSPWWLLGVLPFTAVAASATITPKIEIYTMLVCSVHKPDIFKLNFPNGSLGGSIDVSSPNVYHNVSTGIERGVAIFAEHHAMSSSSPNQNLCASDPVVQAAVAQLSTVIATSMGILSCLTTGWWGAFSDRHGRTRVMGISILGLLFTECNFIFVTRFSKYVPGGYWFLVLGAIVEGSLGGLTTGVASMHAYLADTSTESTRSRVFSLALGLMFTGMAIGPTFGGLLIRLSGTALSVFYAAAFLHSLYAVLVWLILPESLSRVHRARSQAKHEGELRAARGGVGVMKRVFGFLTPLAVFSPFVDDEGEGGNPLKRKRRDWNLTLLAVGYGLTISLMGSYTPKFQYAASMFGWTSETLGYWLSLVGAARAVFLALILPVAIKLFKPKPIILEFPTNTPTESESEPLLSSTTTSPERAQKIIRKEIHSPAFDLNLARTSLFIDAVAYAFMGLTGSPFVFTIFGVLAAMGAGFSPAVQSVTLTLYSRRGGTESGKLFGALSVVQALCSQIIGPSLYGLVYMKTVATFPRAIFVVSVCTVSVGLFMLTLVRLPKDAPRVHVSEEVDGDVEETEGTGGEGVVREATLVDVGAEDMGKVRAR